MKYRQSPAPQEYYHVFNRSNQKQTIFHDKQDHERFLLVMLLTQYTQPVRNISRLSVQSLTLHKYARSEKLVDIIAFCIMPNHFHLLLFNKTEAGVSKYMQRLLTSYSKYYNQKYGSSGHLFQGRYGRTHISDDTQLLHTSAYIHRNPRELDEWRSDVYHYPWSSAQDYISNNRWDELMTRDIIINHFQNSQEYQDFLNTSPTRLTEAEQEMLQ